MKKKIQAALALFLMTTPLLAQAQQEEKSFAPDTTMAEVVVTATRSAEQIKEIPVKVEVIDSQTIEQTVAQTISDQLKKNTSIGVIEYPGALAGIGIRGFRPEFSGITKHTLVLINGRPSGATNLATILSDNIERIEVLKGPASSLYGGEAMGGVVNIITKKNTEELTGMVDIGIGSFNTNFQKAAIGGRVKEKIDFDLSARRYEQDDDFTMGNGETRANTSYQTQNGNLRLGVDFADSWRIDLSTDLYQGRDIESPGDISYGDTRAGYKDIDRYGADLTVGGELGPNNEISLTFYRTRELTENYDHHYYGTPVPTYEGYDSETNWFGVQLKDTYTWEDHRFITGIDYQDISSESRSYNTDGTRKAPWSPDEGRENWAGYLETVWKLMDKKLTATVGGRYDTFEVETEKTPYKTDFTPNAENFSTFSPRAGLNYLTNQGLRFHTTVGKAFVPPAAGELAGYSESVVGSVTMITQGNPNLDPESSITYDLGVGYDQSLWGLSVDFTYFHTDVDDKITRVTSGSTTSYENTLSAEMNGLESTLSFDLGVPLHWERTLSFFVNATHMFDAEEEQSDGTMVDILNVAKHTINYGIQYDDGRVDGKIHCRNQGRMKDIDWTAAGYPEIEYPSFTVVDLMVGFNFLDNHRLTLKADNLFDKDYYEKKGYPKPGCAFYADYSYEF